MPAINLELDHKFEQIKFYVDLCECHISSKCTPNFLIINGALKILTKQKWKFAKFVTKCLLLNSVTVKLQIFEHLLNNAGISKIVILT